MVLGSGEGCSEEEDDAAELTETTDERGEERSSENTDGSKLCPPAVAGSFSSRAAQRKKGRRHSGKGEMKTSLIRMREGQHGMAEGGCSHAALGREAAAALSPAEDEEKNSEIKIEFLIIYKNATGVFFEITQNF